MIIENPDALRAWLTACLEPKCDADPAALAKYVMALVKKDKPEKELRDICLDQLDVFLQKGTKPFVDILFETLSNKSYLKQSPITLGQSLNGSRLEIEKNNVLIPIETTTSIGGTASGPLSGANTASANSGVIGSLNGSMVINKPVAVIVGAVSPPINPPFLPVASSATISNNPILSNSKIDGKRNKLENESDERDPKRSRIARSKSRSKSPLMTRGGRTKPDIRDTDDRRTNRRFPDDDRRRRNFPSRRYDNRYRDFRRGGGGGGDGNERDRDRDRDFRIQRSKDRNNVSSSSNVGRSGGGGERMGNLDRGKSQSRSRSNSPWKRTRSWSRSRSPSRSRSRSISHSRSRSWSRSRDRNRDSGRNENRDSHIQQQQQNAGPPNEHGDKDYRNTSAGNANSSGTSSSLVAQPANVNNPPPPLPPPPPSGPALPPLPGENPQGFRSNKHANRCRDYDEKGYCMRGDLCPFDHGMDPVVLEDVSVLGFGPPNSGNVPPPSHGVPPQLAPPPSGAPMPPLLAPMLGQQPPRAPISGANVNTLPPQSEAFIPEPYNPEAPGMERPSRMHNSFWNHPPPGPPGGPPMRPMGPRGPPHIFHSQQRTRELIGVPTVDNSELCGGGNSVGGSKPCRTVLEPLQPHSDTEHNSSSGLGGSNQDQQQQLQGIARHQMNYGGARRGGGHDGGFRRRIFDYNRLAPRKMAHHNVERCTLELRKVPRHQNTISELNLHFSKFGTIVNLQVCFGGDPEAALVQFSSHSEANAGYRCTDAVLNNRFIKVFWHNNDNALNNNIVSGNQSGQILNNSIESNTQQQQLRGAAENRAPIDSEHNSAAKGGMSILPNLAAPKPSIKERLGVNTAMTKVNNNNLTKKNNSAFALANNAQNSLEDASTTAAIAAATTEKMALFTPTGNLSRTVFNPAALKKNNLLSNITGIRKTKEEQKKEALKKKLEVQTKRQEFIQLHVQQQKLLVEKLEKCKTDKEKTNIKETMRDLGKTIEDLQSEVRKEATQIANLNKAIMQAIPKTKTEPVSLSKAEKELLDAEMDLYNKQHRGDDTSELNKKVNELKQQAKALGLLDSGGQLRIGLASATGFIRGGGAVSRGFRGRGGRGGGILPRKLTSFDRRPKKLMVEGNFEREQNNLLLHFSQYAQIERLEMLENSVAAVVTFKTRRDAEKVISLGSKFNDQALKLSWFVDPTLLTVDALEGASENELQQLNDENLDQSEDEDILLGDDEEEEDSEARSWRR